jgi:hypothetical protein
MAELIPAILNRAALVVEQGWSQHKSARDFAGREVEAHDPAAMCWCACGAIDVAIRELGAPVELYDRVCNVLGGDQALIRFNDAPGRSAADVAAFLRSGAATVQTGQP